MAVKLVIPWDTVQMPAEFEWRIWHQLLGAYGINDIAFYPALPECESLAYEHYDTFGEAIQSSIGQRVFLDADGDKAVSEIPKSGDITIIVGNTSMPIKGYARDDEIYKITCPSPGEMYGMNAAAIALAYRHEP